MRTRGSLGRPLPAEIRHELARAVAERGERAVVDLVGCSAPTLARAMSGLTVYGATAAAVRAFIATAAEAEAEKVPR